MNYEIVGIGESTAGDIQQLSGNRAFRKATRNMKLAYLALSDAMNEIEEGLKSISTERISLFITSGFGELEPTTKFLQGAMIDSKLSPTAFQNSLHNSILGFISTMFKLDGPCYTITNTYFSCENALDAALDTLGQEAADVAIVIGVDSIVRDIEDSMNFLYPSVTKMSEGGNAIILSNRKCKDVFFSKSTVNASIKSISYIYQKNSSEKRIPESFYDTDLLGKIHCGISEKSQTIMSYKPDGSSSLVEISY
jgi:hypothetical protein